ncbi:MAG: NAD(P)H-hydrate dehydratase [Spirochaetota bacterium]|nr:NAD(P)H-hydrate dehydratase [Spirochaetota bacterium]
MKVVTKSEMEYIDRETSNVYKIPSTLLMENAGIAITYKIMEIYPQIVKSTNNTVIVGPGNNGGDGLVIARQFLTQKIPVQIIIIGNRDKFNGDPLINLEISEKLNIPLKFICSLKEWEMQEQNIFSSFIIIDAIFGTGLKDKVKDLFNNIIQSINKNKLSKVISVDIPSGMLSIEDKQNETIIFADDTITVGLPKIGMVDYPGKSYVGKLHIVNIGFPETLLTDKQIHTNLITLDMVKNILPKRQSNTHKGDFGHVLVIAGSKKYTGAAILTCKSALRSGCGLVTLASVATVCSTLRNQFPEAICMELPETNDGYISSESFSLISHNLSSYQTVIIGPGLGQSPSTKELLDDLLINYTGKVVIDADGINLLSQNLDLLKKSKCEIILTPHLKEMSRLMNKTINEIKSNKIAYSREFSKKYNIVLCLKSAVTLISDSNGELYYNTTGNEGMSTGGTGDVLTGIIAGLMAQGVGVLESTILGTYIHGLTGDYVKLNSSSQTLIASDIINNLHHAFNKLNSENLNEKVLFYE